MSFCRHRSECIASDKMPMLNSKYLKDNGSLLLMDCLSIWRPMTNLFSRALQTSYEMSGLQYRLGSAVL